MAIVALFIAYIEDTNRCRDRVVRIRTAVRLQMDALARAGDGRFRTKSRDKREWE